MQSEERKMFIAYHIEVTKCIPNRDLDYDPKYQYARGWNDHKNSVSVVSLVTENEWLTLCPEFYPEWRDEFLEFASRGRLVGFNNHQFDNKFLNRLKLKLTNTIDMLTEVRVSAFGSPFYTDQPAFKYNLGFIAKANGYQKTEEGSQAPKLWQDGHHDKVIEYCLNDTKIIYALWHKFLAGELIDPNTGAKLKPPSS